MIKVRVTRLNMFSFVIFFFKQKTAYEMRISDWSSDVCSSDLSLILYARGRFEVVRRSTAERSAKPLANSTPMATLRRWRPHVRMVSRAQLDVWHVSKLFPKARLEEGLHTGLRSP